MQHAISRDRQAMRQRYGDAPRHTMQVDFAPYVSMVKRERNRGAARARKIPSPQKAKIVATGNI
jgi:hypothetical protein